MHGAHSGPPAPTAQPPSAETHNRHGEEQRKVLDQQSKVCAAFVVFENEESVKRCLHDYHKALGCRQPKQLRFEGKYPLQARTPAAVMF